MGRDVLPRSPWGHSPRSRQSAAARNVDIVGEGHTKDLAVPVRIATEHVLKIVAYGIATEGLRLGGNPLVATATPTIFR